VPVAARRDPHRFLCKDKDEVKRGLSLPQINSGYIDDAPTSTTAARPKALRTAMAVPQLDQSLTLSQSRAAGRVLRLENDAF
jgi:hypothetical protein